MNIDDNFLADDSWDTTAHTTDYDPAAALREGPSDVDYAATWSAANKFRIDQLFNGGGSVQFAGTGTDPLLAEFKKTDPATGKPYTSDFGWINHTWDHPNLDQGCATQNYIEAEIQQNTAWGSSAAGLNLTSTSDAATALGAENPSVVVTGEHSGLANLLPGNPGIIDPPSFDSATVSPTGGTLPAGSYTYAITDQFSATGGESSASETVQTVPANGSVALTWDAVCHAFDYKIYREVTGSNAWTLVKTIPAVTDTTAFANPASTTDTTGGGPLPQSFTDNGAAGTAAPVPPTTNSAVESAYEQNQGLDAAFKAIGIKTFGSDSSKPYPNSADATFANGSAPATQYPGGATFTEPSSGAQAEARYPTNIYYNVSTERQEIDEYNHLYLSTAAGGACTNSATTTCLSTPATFADIINSITQGMLQHILGNDPRPDYFHQTNMMGSPPAGAPTTGTPPATSPGVGDGLFYSTMDQLLKQYSSYYNVPVQQLTSTQIAQLLAQQATWATNTQVSGYIQGNQVTITNGGAAAQIPLTGITTVGSTYGGTQSGWTNEAAGSTTYTAQSTWPASGVTVTMQLSPASIVANGTSISTATATVTAGANPVSGDTVTFSSSDSGEKIGAVTDNKNGTYTATITSSKTVGSATITATDGSVSPGVSGQATLTQTAGPASSVGVALSPASIVANGTSISTATATVTAGANPVSGDTVTFSSSDSGEKIGAVTDNKNGTYTATITSSKTVGSATITATDGSVSPGVSGRATLTQTAGPASSVGVALSPASIVANGISISTATATVKDAAGHGVGGDHVGFSSSDSAEKISAVTDNKNGTYTATITSSNTAHQVTITATDSSVSRSVSGRATLTQTAVAPSNLQAPSISGTATVGRTLKASPGTWSGTSPISYAYQWQRCNPACSAIAGSRSSSYTLTRNDRGARVRVSVTASNTRGSAQAYSPQFGPVG